MKQYLISNFFGKTISLGKIGRLIVMSLLSIFVLSVEVSKAEDLVGFLGQLRWKDTMEISKEELCLSAELCELIDGALHGTPSKEVISVLDDTPGYASYEFSDGDKKIIQGDSNVGIQYPSISFIYSYENLDYVDIHLDKTKNTEYLYRLFEQFGQAMRSAYRWDSDSPLYNFDGELDEINVTLKYSYYWDYNDLLVEFIQTCSTNVPECTSSGIGLTLRIYSNQYKEFLSFLWD